MSYGLQAKEFMKVNLGKRRELRKAGAKKLAVSDTSMNSKLMISFTSSTSEKEQLYIRFIEFFFVGKMRLIIKKERRRKKALYIEDILRSFYHFSPFRIGSGNVLSWKDMKRFESSGRTPSSCWMIRRKGRR